jgi:hypothetical protein
LDDKTLHGEGDNSEEDEKDSLKRRHPRNGHVRPFAAESTPHMAVLGHPPADRN